MESVLSEEKRREKHKCAWWYRGFFVFPTTRFAQIRSANCNRTQRSNWRRFMLVSHNTTSESMAQMVWNRSDGNMYLCLFLCRASRILSQRHIQRDLRKKRSGRDADCQIRTHVHWKMRETGSRISGMRGGCSGNPGCQVLWTLQLHSADYRRCLVPDTPMPWWHHGLSTSGVFLHQRYICA